VQLCTAQIGLNQHLYQLHQTPEPYFPHCPQEKKRVHHYLINCEYYYQIRQPVRLALPQDWRKINFWLLNKAKQRVVLTYIAKTKRF
jgi:hypothetical protein